MRNYIVCIPESFNNTIYYYCLLQHNICEFTKHSHKLKWLFCIKKTGLDTSLKDFLYTTKSDSNLV